MHLRWVRGCHGKLDLPCNALIIVTRVTRHPFTVPLFCHSSLKGKEAEASWREQKQKDRQSRRKGTSLLTHLSFFSNISLRESWSSYRKYIAVLFLPCLWLLPHNIGHDREGKSCWHPQLFCFCYPSYTTLNFPPYLIFFVFLFFYIWCLWCASAALQHIFAQIPCTQKSSFLRLCDSAFIQVHSLSKERCVSQLWLHFGHKIVIFFIIASILAVFS